MMMNVISLCLTLFLTGSVTARNQLGQASSMSTPRFTCRWNEALLEVVVKTDNFPLDTSWMVVSQNDGHVLDFVNEGGYPLPMTTYSKGICLKHGNTYQLTILDSHGDGLCCGHGQGYYKVTLEGEEIYSGGQFALMVEHTFTVSSIGSTGPPPTPNPTPAPAPSSSVNNNRIVHPHCNPNSPTYNPSSDDSSSCSGMLAHCARDGSVHKWEYDAAETMLDRCFRSCADRLGIDSFCSLTQPPPMGSPAMPYCDSEGQVSDWTSQLHAMEDEFVSLLNQQRAQGYTCPGNEYYPPVPSVKRNPQLDCAARAQARKIVNYSQNIGFNDDSPSLHKVCNYSRGNCDSFSERIESAGYVDWWGYVGENANWGYTTALSTLQGWSDSSGHCPLLMKQDWAHILVEIGVGYYQDPQSGSASWVMVAGQR
jgi:uncharacterized protein YkwD